MKRSLPFVAFALLDAAFLRLADPADAVFIAGFVLFWAAVIAAILSIPNHKEHGRTWRRR